MIYLGKQATIVACFLLQTPLNCPIIEHARIIFVPNLKRGETVNGVHSNKTTTRVLSLLESLSRGAQGSLRTLEEQTGIPRSSLCRLLADLETEGWIWKDDDRYVPGARFTLLCARLEKPTALIEASKKIMWQLAQSTEKTVLLCRREGAWGVCLHTEEPTQPVKFVAHTGMKIPLYAGATGKVLLAWAPEDLRQQVLNQLTSPLRQSLNEDLKSIRSQGYCFSQEEWIPHAADLSAPLFNAHGIFIGQLGLAGLAGTFDDQFPSLLAKLRSATEQICREI